MYLSLSVVSLLLKVSHKVHQTCLDDFASLMLSVPSQRGCSLVFPQDNTGLVSRGASLISWRESASLALVGHPSSDGVTMKIPYELDVLLHQPASHPIFLTGLVKTEFYFIIRSVKTGLGRWMLVVAVISVDAYPFLAFPGLTCHLEDTGIGVFWFHCATW